MTDEEKAIEIRKNLRERFPDMVFQVFYNHGSLSLGFLGGNRYVDEFPNRKDAVDALVAIVRKTIPDFEVLDYE